MTLELSKHVASESISKTKHKEKETNVYLTTAINTMFVRFYITRKKTKQNKNKDEAFLLLLYTTYQAK